MQRARAPARARSPAAPTSSSARAQGRRRCRTSLVAIHRLAELRGIERVGRIVFGSARSRPTRSSPPAPTCASGSPRSPTRRAIVGSHATRAQGTIGGNVMNASPAMETGGPLVCFDATVTLLGGRDAHAGRRRRPLRRTRADDRGARTSCSPRSTCRSAAPAPGSCYLRLEYRQQMEIAVVGATAVVTLDGRLA